MSGTSMDGIDLAFCRFTEHRRPEETGKGATTPWAYEILRAETFPLPHDWKQRLQELNNCSAAVFARTDVEFGHFLGRSICKFIQDQDIRPQFIASHGQTIFHQPENSFTTQIGDGESIASYLEVPLVTQFRNKDVALGGQGAPLVPFGEKLLFPPDYLFLNLGGIANLTCGNLAFDVCACNMALDWLAGQLSLKRGFDPEGRYAASGQIIPALLQNLESLSWYHVPPPKSLGKEWFESAMMPLFDKESRPVKDQLATCVEHIATRIVKTLADEIPKPGSLPLLVSGGGAHNAHLIHTLQHKINTARLSIHLTSDPMLTDFKEAMIFAFLGLQALLGKTNTLTSVTGASQSCIGGSIHLPPNIKGFRLPLTPCASGV